MSIKFRNSEQIYNVDVTVPVWRSVVQLSGKELPTEANDFDVLNEEGTIIDYFEGFDVIYDSGDNYIQFTNDSNIYYDYLVFDENNYVIGTFVTTDSSYKDGYLYQSGQGKKYKSFYMDLYNDDDFPLYKIENNKLIETSEEEREIYHEEMLKKQLENEIDSKISECTNVCSTKIIEGIEYNEEHFTYEIEDQNNILNLVQLASQTGLSVPYHAAGKSCRLFTKEEITNIYIQQEANLTHHITYNNQLKLYIKNELITIDDVKAVTYGQELEGKYLETYNTIMSQAKEIINSYINTLS